MWALLALAGAANATDVLVPEATPATLDDFSIAGLFTGMVLSAAEDAGLDVEGGDAIRAWAKDDADTCWDNDACPANLWDRTDARLAIVMSVGQTPAGLEVAVRLHNVDDASPLKVLRDTVRPGGEQAYAETIVRAAKDALSLLPERKPAAADTFVLDEQTITGDDELPDLDGDEPKGPTRKPVDVDEPDEPRTTKPASKPDKPPADKPRPDKPARPTSMPRSGDRAPALAGADDERRRMGVPDGAYARYQESGLRREEWLAKARVRAGHVFLELGGGYSLGDVDRGYGVRLRIEPTDDAFTTVGTSTWEGAGASSAPGFGFAVGYAPAWFLDTSVAVAFQYGQKYLDTGWECLDGCEAPADEFPHDPVSAVQVFLEPRVRLYPVATGVLKPYALVGFSVLFHDGYQVPDPDLIDYPDTAAGAAFGPTAGVGVAADVVSRFSLYAEVPATLLLTHPTTVQDGDVTLAPDQLESSGYVLRFTGGISVRL